MLKIDIRKSLPSNNFELIQKYKDSTYNRVLLAMSNNEIVGIAMLRVSVNIKMIEIIALETSEHNKGTGKEIINYVKRICRRKSASILLTSLKSSVGFYLKQGFESLDGAISDTIMMWKPSYD